MSRKEARELVFQALYQLDMIKGTGAEVSNNILAERPIKDVQYFKEVLFGIEQNLPALDERIQKFSKKWKVERLSKVDKAILRLGVYEILMKEDVPDIVAINEAVELAKEYSGAESPKFINGILDEIRKEKDAQAGN